MGDNCHKDAVCTNTEGSYTCACKKGFRGSDGTVCTDIDECKENKYSCPSHSSCNNRAGDYSCVCDDGYIGDGTRCEMNKCANNPCANGGQCNALGVASFNCSCTNGWGGATCEEAITAITAEDSATTATVVGIVSGVVAGIIVIVIVIVVVICVTRNPGGDKNDVVTPRSPSTPRTPRGTRI